MNPGKEETKQKARTAHWPGNLDVPGAGHVAPDFLTQKTQASRGDPSLRTTVVIAQKGRQGHGDAMMVRHGEQPPGLHVL